MKLSIKISSRRRKKHKIIKGLPERITTTVTIIEERKRVNNQNEKQITEINRCTEGDHPPDRESGEEDDERVKA